MTKCIVRLAYKLIMTYQKWRLKMPKKDTASIQPDNEEISIKEYLNPHSEITTKLRNFFSEIEQQPLPEKYLELLNKLDEAEKQQNKNK